MLKEVGGGGGGTNGFNFIQHLRKQKKFWLVVEAKFKGFYM